MWILITLNKVKNKNVLKVEKMRKSVWLWNTKGGQQLSRQELPAGEFFDSPGNEAQDIFEEKAHVAKTASFCYSRKAISCKVKFFHAAWISRGALYRNILKFWSHHVSQEMVEQKDYRNNQRGVELGHLALAHVGDLEIGIFINNYIILLTISLFVILLPMMPKRRQKSKGWSE